MRGTLVDGRYRLGQRFELGAGHAGDAGASWHAQDERLHRPAVVTVFGADVVAGPAVHGTLELFARVTHPGLCPVLDAGEHDQRVFVVSPPPSGPALSDALAEDALTRRDVVAAGAAVAAALAELHSHGLQHGGLTAHCVLLPSVPDGEGRQGVRVAGAGFGLLAGGSPSDGADVRDLGLLLEAALARTGGAPRPGLSGLLAGMADTRPRARPAAAVVAERLAGLAADGGDDHAGSTAGSPVPVRTARYAARHRARRWVRRRREASALVGPVQA